MPEPGQFSVTTAMALVLGGVLALALAIAVAIKDPKKPSNAVSPGSRASAEAARPDVTAEYPLELGDDAEAR